jgi:hypothetical protein
MILLGFLFLAFIFIGIGYGWGHHDGYMQAANKYRKEMDEALDEKERGIQELRKRNKYRPMYQGRN